MISPSNILCSLTLLIHFSFAAVITASMTAQLFASNITHECLDRQEVYGRTTTIYHGSSVEPTIAVNPKNKNHIVAAWQQDRISNGGSLDAGVSYSRDGGKHWHKCKVSFQICDGGINQRSGDEWLSYSADGSKVYLCASVLNATKEPNTNNQFGVVVTISEDDGATWSEPRYLFSSMNYLSEPTHQFANSDKTSITADPNNKDRAIAVWATFNPSSSYHGNAQSSYTTDGGKNWSAVQQVYDPFPDLTQQGLSNGIQNDNQASNNVVLILPKREICKKRRLSGDWLDFAVRVYAKPGATDEQYTNDAFPFKYTIADIVTIRSKDHGKTWNPNAKVVVPSFVNNLLYTGGYTYDANGNIIGGLGSLMRDDQTVPSYNVNPKNGFLYVAYQTSTFREDKLPQIGLVTSRDGGHTWSKGVNVSRTPTNCSNPQAFEPFVAVTKNGRVGILYFDFRNDDRSNFNKTKMDAWLAIYQEVKCSDGGSTTIGFDFVEEIRLSEKSYIAQNGPNTSQGFMTDGDYQFLTTQGNNFYAIYTKSLKGPFTPATVFFKDPVHKAIVLLDNNYRTAPFVSIIKNCKNGADLILTKKLK
ncbi:MAG: exo-alpha-sialidase [Parachlamydiaceae bacterium]|nr:exo-alpha-sialidase [Parachlamydiaceae bacterium]